jgi:uncharacterized protein (DUF427 family)
MAQAHIKIRQLDGCWVVRAAGAVLAESKTVLEMREGDYPPVIYFPRDDIGMEFLEPSKTKSICPHKGEASYFGIAAKSGLIENAAWSYENPMDGVERIRGYIAFFPQTATVEEL